MSDREQTISLIIVAVCIMLLTGYGVIQTNRVVALHGRVADLEVQTALLEQQIKSPPMVWARTVYQSKLSELSK
ncbi:MAG: hypothetical protein ACAH80_08670 [Alphaproteobacteria bacterium]